MSDDKRHEAWNEWFDIIGRLYQYAAKHNLPPASLLLSKRWRDHFLACCAPVDFPPVLYRESITVMHVTVRFGEIKPVDAIVG